VKKSVCKKNHLLSLLKEASDNKAWFEENTSPFNLTAIGLGAIIGAGLFVLSW